MRKFLLGCSAYRGIMPSTAISREEVVAAALRSQLEGLELAGTRIEQGYGAIRNASRVFACGLELAGDDGFVLHHDADVSFEQRSVAAIVAAYDGLCAEEGHSRHLVGAGYPSSSDPGLLVGHPTGAPWRAGEVELSPADRLGFGFILVPCALLRAMAQPWLSERWDGANLTTGDTVFCENTLAVGWSISIASIPGVKHHVTVQMGLDE